MGTIKKLVTLENADGVELDTVNLKGKLVDPET